LQAEERRRTIHSLLKSYVSAEAAERYLADPDSVRSLGLDATS
jgi:hypothetical protein